MKWFIFLFLSINSLHAASVGIVGGGASGLASAWLLEQEHEVTVFEREDRFGGHAMTIDVELEGQAYPVDAGFEFFSDTMHPTLFKLISMLGVPTNTFPLTYSFFTEDGSTIVLPPIADNKVNWNALWPSNLLNLLQFKYTFIRGQKYVDEKNKSITLEEFAEKISLSSSFCENFFYPLIAGSWMVSVEDIKSFAAYDILKWLTEYSPAEFAADELYEVVGGTSIYIQELVNQLQHTDLKLSADIQEITYQNGKYNVLLASGELFTFDHLILATNAIDANKLLTSVPHAEEARSSLGLMKYHHTKMALHGDMSYMPEDSSSWSMMNVRMNTDGVCSSVYKPWGTPAQYPVLRTCISFAPNIPLPEPLYATVDFYHPLVTPSYFQAQESIRLLQGQENLWFAGMHTYDTDSHESAIMSAVMIAQSLSPMSQRLQELQQTQPSNNL